MPGCPLSFKGNLSHVMDDAQMAYHEKYVYCMKPIGLTLKKSGRIRDDSASQQTQPL